MSVTTLSFADEAKLRAYGVPTPGGAYVATVTNLGGKSYAWHQGLRDPDGVYPDGGSLADGCWLPGSAQAAVAAQAAFNNRNTLDVAGQRIIHQAPGLNATDGATIADTQSATDVLAGLTALAAVTPIPVATPTAPGQAVTQDYASGGTVVTQALWNVDPIAGVDATADGSAGKPYKHGHAAIRAWGPKPRLGNDVEIRYASAPAADDYLSVVGIRSAGTIGASRLLITGGRTVVDTAPLTGVRAINYGVDDGAQQVSATGLAAQFTTYLFDELFIPSGPRAGASSWVMIDALLHTATTPGFLIPNNGALPNATEVAPVAGGSPDTIQVVTPWAFALPCDFRDNTVRVTVRDFAFPLSSEAEMPMQSSIFVGTRFERCKFASQVACLGSVQTGILFVSCCFSNGLTGHAGSGPLLFGCVAPPGILMSGEMYAIDYDCLFLSPVFGSYTQVNIGTMWSYNVPGAAVEAAYGCTIQIDGQYQTATGEVGGTGNGTLLAADAGSAIYCNCTGGGFPVGSTTDATKYASLGGFPFFGEAPTYYTKVQLPALHMGDGAQIGFISQSGVKETLIAGNTSLPINVRAYGAKGDGVTDYTAAIQAAINAAIAAVGGTVLFPIGTYKTGALSIANATRLALRGSGAVLNWSGTAAGLYLGFHLSGTCSRVVFDGVEMNGDGVLANKHAGVWADLAENLTDIRIVGCKVTNCVNGFRFNTGTTLQGVRIERCYLDTIVGSASGQGYGITFSAGAGTGNINGVVVSGNTIIGAQRHSIYLAGGTDAVIASNQILRHRVGLGNSFLPAIVVARCRDVTVHGNVVESSDDYGLTVEEDSTSSITTSSVTIIGNCFALNAGPDVNIGNGGGGGFYVDGCVVIGNTFRRANNVNPAIRVANGKRLTIEGNDISAPDAHASGYAAIYLTAPGGTANCAKIVVRNNTLNVGSAAGTQYLVESAQNLSTTDGIWVTVERNVLDGPSTAMVLFDVAPTNTTFVIDGVGLYIAGSTTPSVANGVRFMAIANAGPTSITNFVGGVTGQKLALVFRDSNTTITQANSVLPGATDYSSVAYNTLHLLKTGDAGSYWHGLAHENNASTPLDQIPRSGSATLAVDKTAGSGAYVKILTATITPRTAKILVSASAVGDTDNATPAQAIFKLQLNTVDIPLAVGAYETLLNNQESATIPTQVVAVTPGALQTVDLYMKSSAGNARVRPATNPTTDGASIVLLEVS